MMTTVTGIALWNQVRWFSDGVLLYVHHEEQILFKRALEEYARACILEEYTLMESIHQTVVTRVIPAEILRYGDGDYTGTITYSIVKETIQVTIDVFRQALPVFSYTCMVYV